MTIKNVTAHFSTILGVSCLLVNKSQNYKVTRKAIIKWKTWRAKDRQKMRKV